MAQQQMCCAAVSPLPLPQVPPTQRNNKMLTENWSGENYTE